MEKTEAPKDSAALRNIYECIRKAAGLDGLKAVQWGTAIVKEVNEADRKCTAEIVYGTTTMEIDAALSPENNDGFILIPAADSTVQICIMPDNTCYVSQCSDIDKVICVIDGSNAFIFDKNGFIWNKGLNGGLIKITNLTSDLNTLVSNANTNYTAIAAAIAALGGAYVVVPAVPFVKTSYENTSIKH